jgi:cation:H+ antiporter
MQIEFYLFIPALVTLLLFARFFTKHAVKLGSWFKLPEFVIGIFIVGIGTSLPELVSGILSVSSGNSEILPGNIIGADISNMLLVTGIAVIIYRKNIDMGSLYIQIDLHFLLAAIFIFTVIAFDGFITPSESIVFIVYSVYLIKGGKVEANESKSVEKFPLISLLILVISALGIYYGAEYTVASITAIAQYFNVPSSIIALTLLSLGTTLPELAVNIEAIRQNKADMAIGNVLGSSVFNTLTIPAIASFFGEITVPPALLNFALPFLCATTVLFYLITQDKKISVWEGFIFVILYLLFLLKTAV